MSIQTIYNLFLLSEGIGTDTRKELGGKLFFALRGENFNGNKYALSALEKGAIYAIIDEVPGQNDDRFILVDDVLQCLQDLANHHRNMLGIPVLGITGSNGKTTSKELIHLVLSKKYKVFSTKGNLNNHIGVPLSLLECSKETEIAVIEMGANKPGDIAELCEIAEPDFGFITNIGSAHLEGLGSIKGVQETKGALFESVKNVGGILFVNGDESLVHDLVKDYEKYILVGEGYASFCGFNLLQAEPHIMMEVSFENQKSQIESALYGLHNYQNIKMAVTIGLYFDIPLDAISDAVQSYIPENNRSQILQLENMTVFLDAYNANPVSMEKSIDSFIAYPGKEKVIIVGDMLELGAYSEQYHREILNKILDYDWVTAIFVGQNFHKVAIEKENVFYYDDIHALNNIHVWNMPRNVSILVKGSRGQTLEKLKILNP